MSDLIATGLKSTSAVLPLELRVLLACLYVIFCLLMIIVVFVIHGRQSAGFILS